MGGFDAVMERIAMMPMFVNRSRILACADNDHVREILSQKRDFGEKAKTRTQEIQLWELLMDGCKGTSVGNKDVMVSFK